jgi:hypothetical protein
VWHCEWTGPITLLWKGVKAETWQMQRDEAALPTFIALFYLRTIIQLGLHRQAAPLFAYSYSFVQLTETIVFPSYTNKVQFDVTSRAKVDLWGKVTKHSSHMHAELYLEISC